MNNQEWQQFGFQWSELIRKQQSNKIKASEKMGQCDSTSISNRYYLKANLKKDVIDFNTVKPYCTFLAEGYQSKVYLYPSLNIVLKVMKKPYLTPILNEIKILDHLKPIWPQLCHFQIIASNKIIGFTTKYFEGKKIDLILQDKQNIYHKNKSSRIKLVKKLKNLISKIQDLNICHGDIYYENIIIRQPDIDSQECQVIIIDFGNGFIFDENTRTDAGLNGWSFMVPPEAKKKKKYDPKGVNAYQLGRLALQILLLRSLQEYNDGKINENPMEELSRVEQEGFDESVVNQIREYLSDDLDRRVQMLGRSSEMEEICREIVSKSRS